MIGKWIFDQAEVKRRFMNSSFMAWIVSKTQSIRVSRNYDISLYEALKEYNQSQRKQDIYGRSKALAYNYTLAIFPSIIFIFTLIPYLPFEQYVSVEEVLIFLESSLPAEVWDFIGQTIEDIISRQRGGLLSFGFLTAVWLATNGMYSLIEAFNKTYKSRDSRGLFVKRLIALFLTVLLVFVLVSAILLLVFGQIIVDLILTYVEYMSEYISYIDFISDYGFYLSRGTQFGVFGIIFLIAISTIYTVAPAVKKRWRFITVGSVVGTLMSMFVSGAFSYYLNNFSSYNKLYGSIGALIGIMLWLQMMSYILLVGFQINASIDAVKNRSKKR